MANAAAEEGTYLDEGRRHIHMSKVDSAYKVPTKIRIPTPTRTPYYIHATEMCRSCPDTRPPFPVVSLHHPNYELREFLCKE